LADILVERPPLAHSEPLAMTASKTAAIPLRCTECGETYFTDSLDEKHDCATKTARFEDTPESMALFEAAGDLLGKANDYMVWVDRPGEIRCPNCNGSMYDPAGGVCEICGGQGFLVETPVRDDLDDSLETPEIDATAAQVAGAGDHVFFATAGLWDTLLAPVVDKATEHIDTKYPGIETGTAWSYDWCRFRRDRHCYFPREMDLQATQQAGYAVWKPLDRGICGRDKWAEQQQCPVAEPGPHSGSPKAQLDATVSWEDGGQRGGVVGALAGADRDHVFEFTASWSDVRSKASAIRSKGGVRVVSIDGDRATGRTITAQVQGDTHVYETSIQSEPGRSNVALWTCGCPWAAYSWGRSGRWKRYEGRMCSHALALTYESASKNLMEQPDAPAWAEDSEVMRPGDYDADAQTYRAASLRPVAIDADLFMAPATKIAIAMKHEGASDRDVVAAFGPRIMAQANVMDFKGRLTALVRGVLKHVKEIVSETGKAIMTDGSEVPISDVIYPTFHPTLGLTAALHDDGDYADTGDDTEYGSTYPTTSDSDMGWDPPLDEMPGGLGACEVCGAPATWAVGVHRLCSADKARLDVLRAAAELKDEPEAAVPQTTGEEDDDDSGDGDGKGEVTFVAADEVEDPGEGDPQDRTALRASGASVTLAGPQNPGLAWLASPGGAPGAQAGSDADIAENARQYLAKQGLKTFSPAEQAAIIDEGEDEIAANLASLDLSGTHYQALEEALASQDDPEDWLS